MSFKNLNILILGIRFYDYEIIIKNKLISLGAKVDLYYQVDKIIVFNSYFNLIKNYNKKIYQEKLLNKVCEKNYDLILIFKGEDISYNFISRLKSNNKNSKLILYLWDEICRIKDISKKFIFFDNIFSFDRLDCIKNKSLTFRPLFYRDDNKSNISNLIYDLSFVGYFHSNREILQSLFYKANYQKNFTTFLHLYTGKFQYIKRKLIGNTYCLYSYPLSYSDVNYIYSSSKSIIDIPYTSQSGLSMRIIESLCHGKKIITSNKDIINYEFYDKDLIYLFENENLTLNDNFLINKEKKLYKNFNKEYYSLNRWLCDVLLK